MDQPAPADFKSFFLRLETPEQTRFAERAGTTVGYIRAHLIYGRKVPRPDLMDRLTAACAEFGSTFSKEDLVLFFYRNKVAA